MRNRFSEEMLTVSQSLMLGPLLTMKAMK
jgi:hypothetical protein